MSEWREVNIGDIANLYQGLAINKKTNYLLVDKSSLPLLRIKDLQENTQEFFVNDKEAPKKCIANENDLIFTRTGIVGMVFMGKKGVVHNNCFRIVPKNDEVYLPFYYHFFNRENIRDYLTNISAGSVQPDMNHTIFNTVKVPFPPLEEQKAIAEVLSSLDDKIDLLHRQNKTLEELAQTLFRQWFVEEADEGWEEGSIEDITTLKSGKSRPKEESETNSIPIYGGNGILGYTNQFNAENESIIIGRVGAYCGSLYLENQPIWVSDNALLAKAKNSIYTKFLFYTLKNNELNSMAEGSSHPLLTQGLLKSIPIVIPPDEKLNAFNTQVNTWYEKINFNKQQIKILENMRDTLLPKLMSGEVRVE